MTSVHPEGSVPPATYYSTEEAQQYTRRSRIAKVQAELTERCIELLQMEQKKIAMMKETAELTGEEEKQIVDTETLESGSEEEEEDQEDMAEESPESEHMSEILEEAKQELILDIGCGSGLSGDILSQNGYQWIGMDISPAMLEVARLGGVEGDMLQADIGQLQRFRPGVFDGAISVSVIQWLLHAYSSNEDPVRRLGTFFRWLYNVLKPGARAALQFYPSHASQTQLIGKAAAQAGFSAGFVVDNPESDKKRKTFLLLGVGVAIYAGSPQQKAGGERRNCADRRVKKKRGSIKNREWVLAKKDRQRQKGFKVRTDTKYTGRRRKARF